MQAWQAADRFEADRELAPWLATIARRVAIDVHRREARRAAEALDDVPAADPALVTMPTGLEQWYEAWQVRHAIDQLPADEREVVRLQHLEGFTHAEIAARLGVPAGTVKSRSHRAHQRLARSCGRSGRRLHEPNTRRRRTVGCEQGSCGRPHPGHPPGRPRGARMTTHEERMAMLAGRDLDALDVEERAQVESWTTLLADPSLWTEPPPDLEDRVVTSIATTAPPTHSWVSSTERSGSWVRPLLAGLAVAAAIVAAVIVFSHRGSDSTASFALAGTELAPKARGEASVYKDSAGFRIELKAHDLPALDGGRFYQAWLKGDSGLIPIGTFSKGNGTKVTLWSGVSPKDFPTLTVTIEAPDGNQESSGQRVLVGNLTD